MECNMNEFDKLMDEMFKVPLNEGIKRFVDEMDELSDDNKIILNWALQKGYISDEYPTVDEFMDGFNALEDKKLLDVDNLPENMFEDDTELIKNYIRFVLLPEAEESYKNRNFIEPKK